MPLQTPPAGATPRQIFFHTAAQRTALARQQFFDEGVRPTGLVSEAVIQSWMRCVATRAKTSEPVAFDPVTASRLHSTLSRNRELLQAAGDELRIMENSLAGTECRVLLTDAQGVIVHATQSPLAPRQPLLQVASRVGVNIAEARVGTTAPGIVTKTGQPCTVSGAEHFYDCLGHFECAAAPILDMQGRLAAVLDLSVESRSFGFDAATMVGMYATSIENRLLRAQASDHLVLCFQASPDLLGTPLQALAGVQTDGRVAWLNRVGRRLVGTLVEPRDAEAVFGLSLSDLTVLVRCDTPRPTRLANGLGIWLRATMQAADGTDFNHAVALTPPTPPSATDMRPTGGASLPSGADGPTTTLDAFNRQLVEDTLAECGGNIARAARTLGVSRGTLYRRLGRSAVRKSGPQA